MEQDGTYEDKKYNLKDKSNPSMKTQKKEQKILLISRV